MPKKSKTGARWYAELTLDAGSSWKTSRFSVRGLKRFDEEDPALPGSRPSRSGTIYLDKLEVFGAAGSSTF